MDDYAPGVAWTITVASVLHAAIILLRRCPGFDRKANGWQAGPRVSPRDEMPFHSPRNLSVSTIEIFRQSSEE
jgi:hypothetical protein